jgi:hypothetical protein
MIELTSLQSRPDAGGVHTFTALLRIDRKRDVTTEIPPQCLIDYAEFQMHVLRQTGRIFTDIVCDGRPADAASMMWREHVDGLLRQSAAAPSDLN